MYAAKGPFVLYKIHNIIFEHGFDPPPPPRLNNIKKTALFLHDGFPKALREFSETPPQNIHFIRHASITICRPVTLLGGFIKTELKFVCHKT